jgi:beta-lactamase class A
MLNSSLLATPALLSLRAAADDETGSASERALAALERRHGGRLGIAIFDSANSKLVSQRGDEPFALCSYYAEARATDDERNAVLAEVGRLAATL